MKKQEAMGDLNGHIEEIYSNHNMSKYNGEKDANINLIYSMKENIKLI